MKRVLKLALALCVVPMLLAGCDSSSTSTTTQQQGVTNGHQTCAHNAKLSAELSNQCNYYQVMNNPSLVGYVYLMSNTGQLMYEYQVSGKCSSTESSPVPQYHIDTSNEYNGNGVLLVPSAEPDGSYGANENGIFCRLDNAQHSLIEFNAASWNWVWSQVRITFPTPALITVVPNGK